MYVLTLFILHPALIISLIMSVLPDIQACVRADLPFLSRQLTSAPSDINCFTTFTRPVTITNMLNSFWFYFHCIIFIVKGHFHRKVVFYKKIHIKKYGGDVIFEYCLILLYMYCHYITERLYTGKRQHFLSIFFGTRNRLRLSPHEN